MATAIRKPNGSYQIRVFMGKDNAGKQVFKSTTYHPEAKTPVKAKKEAEAFAAKYEKQVRSGRLFDSRITFQKFAEDVWMPQWATKFLTESEQEHYLWDLTKNVFPHIGTLEITKVTPALCQDLLDKRSVGHAQKTTKRTFTALNSVMTFAYKMSVIQENPCTRCTLPRIKNDPADIHLLDPEQVKRLFQFLDGEYKQIVSEHRCVRDGKECQITKYERSYTTSTMDRVMFRLLIETGIRRGELLALCWSDVDLESGLLNIGKAVAKTKKDGLIVKTPKTTAGFRTIAIPQDCVELLRKWKAEEMSLRMNLGTGWNGPTLPQDMYLFIRSDGSRMGLSTPHEKWEKVLRIYNESIEAEAAEKTTVKERDSVLSLKLPEIRLHDLRHTSASILIGNGVDVVETAHRLGHSDPGVTMRVYAHYLPQKDREAAKVLENAFSAV